MYVFNGGVKYFFFIFITAFIMSRRTCLFVLFSFIIGKKKFRFIRQNRWYFSVYLFYYYYNTGNIIIMVDLKNYIYMRIRA